jgi:hypothetical protein
MNKQQMYAGIHNDPAGTMNPAGNIIRDASAIEILAETETCEGCGVNKNE